MQAAANQMTRSFCTECGSGAPGYTIEPDHVGEPIMIQCRECWEFDETYREEQRRLFYKSLEGEVQ